jgi:NAD(P)H-dependent FMN reductase
MSRAVRRILAISGSLRDASSNTRLLRAAAAVAPAGVEVRLYTGLAGLPHFNPDEDVEPALAAVAEFRALLQGADAVLVCSPEYAHGVPGSLKNALDWVVGSGELYGKPVGLLNASGRAVYAQASLAETLKTMGAVLVPGASAVIPLDGRGLDEAGMAADPGVGAALHTVLAALAGV